MGEKSILKKLRNRDEKAFEEIIDLYSAYITAIVRNLLSSKGTKEDVEEIAEELDVPLSFLMYENLNKIPITERVLNILNNKGGKQQEYLLHMLEEMSFGLDRLL